MADQLPRRAPGDVAGFLGLLAVVWVLLVGFLGFRYLAVGFRFMGHGLTRQELHAKGVYLIWLAVALVGVPLVAAVVAAVARRAELAGWLVFATLSLALVGGGLVAVGLRELRHAQPPAPVVQYTGCQARSGGRNDCPGG